MEIGERGRKRGEVGKGDGGGGRVGRGGEVESGNSAGLEGGGHLWIIEEDHLKAF